MSFPRFWEPRTMADLVTHERSVDPKHHVHFHEHGGVRHAHEHRHVPELVHAHAHTNLTGATHP